MADWYYTRGSERIGPRTDDEMRALFASAEITPETLCWQAGSDGDWRPFVQTELHAAAIRDRSAPPPLPPGQIPNFWAYAFAVLPLAGPLVERAGLTLTPTVAVVAYILVYFGLAGLDIRAIRRSGNDHRIPNLAWCVLGPVYLWKRATRLHQPRTAFWVWVACAILGLGVQYEGSGVLLPGSLPTCDSSYAVSQLKSLLKKQGIEIVELNHMREISSNTELRDCTADALFSNALHYKLSYQFKQSGDQIVVIARWTPIIGQ